LKFTVRGRSALPLSIMTDLFLEKETFLMRR
jgi:hypothetical protein